LCCLARFASRARRQVTVEKASPPRIDLHRAGHAGSQYDAVRHLKVRKALKANVRNKVVVSGLWTEVCNATFALSAMLEGGYEIYMVADASGGTSKEAHDYAMQRMIQAGVVPMARQPVMLEWQRDWARKDSDDAVMVDHPAVKIGS
jgi:nicotinamidase-related amidase